VRAFPALWLFARTIVAVLLSLAIGAVAGAQTETVTAHIAIAGKSTTKAAHSDAPTSDAAQVVVWLNRLDPPGGTPIAVEPPAKRPQLLQKNKTFIPHMLVVPVGTTVDFPNHDPFFHNVFSLFDGKRFDLGLYEAGATNSVRFDRLGVSFLFCNIHPEMSAVVVAVDTPYYAISDRSGNVSIPDVPDGKYQLHIWYERSLPEDLRKLTRTITVNSTSKDAGQFLVHENPSFTSSHKNKYGQDYTPPPTPDYSHP
jgi:hypothetical protein